MNRLKLLCKSVNVEFIKTEYTSCHSHRKQDSDITSHLSLKNERIVEDFKGSTPTCLSPSQKTFHPLKPWTSFTTPPIEYLQPKNHKNWELPEPAQSDNARNERSAKIKAIKKTRQQNGSLSQVRDIALPLQKIEHQLNWLKVHGNSSYYDKFRSPI